MIQTQNLILRIVAQKGKIHSGELLESAQKFGLSPDAVRAGANRMVHSGLLAKTGQGRGKVCYAVGPQGQALVNHFVAKLLRWHRAMQGQLAWDGHWLVVTFSIPEEHRNVRDAFRSRLVELGFGLLSASVWLSPFDQAADVTALIEELELVGHVTLLRCQRVWVPGVEDVRELANHAWGLDALAARYRDLNRRFELLFETMERLGQGEDLESEAIFFEAMDLQNELLEIIVTGDPCLPAELLPGDWPSQRIHSLTHVITSAADRLKLSGKRYDYLFHVDMLPGIEELEAFRGEDNGFHWAADEEVER